MQWNPPPSIFECRSFNGDTAQRDATAALAEQWKRDKKSDIAQQIKRGEQVWAKYDDAKKTKRTLRLEDGR